MGEQRRSMSGVDDRFARGLKVPLRALWGKARGGGGRLRHATSMGKKEKKQEKEDKEDIYYNNTIV
jgi:hypothetical protein